MVLILSLENLADACQLLLHYWQDFGLIFHYFFSWGNMSFHGICGVYGISSVDI